MRDYHEIAERFLKVRTSWRVGVEAAKRVGVNAQMAERTAACEREMEALAWVLGVDPDTDAQRLEARSLLEQLEQIDPPERVRLSAIRSYPVWWWLVEFPAEPDPNFKTGYWAAFLSPRQLRQLGVAIAARFGSLGGMSGRRPGLLSLGPSFSSSPATAPTLPALPALPDVSSSSSDGSPMGGMARDG